MKKMKKLLSLVLSVVMVVAMGVTVFAEGNTASTYTITAPATTHQYEIYQIFTGDLANGVLSNVKWGENGTGTKGQAVDEVTLNALTAVNSKSDKEKLAVIEQYANLTNPVATISNGATYTAAAGYYLIKDKDETVSGNDVYTTYIVEVVGNVTISPKSDVPSSEKKVKDTNDTTGETTGWQDSADYDIGDEVPFQLTGTVSSKYDDYKVYKFAFHDQESEGLTFNKDSVKVYVDGTEITTGYTVTTPAGDGDTFDVTFADLKKIDAVHAGSVITVEYTSTLNENAVIGSAGNPNTMHLEYSNNPNDAQGGETGTTPPDTVIVFTYKVVANKVDENGNALKGASFKLEKKLSDGTWKDLGTIDGTDKTTFEWKGLDDGDYRITETVTPAGYNSIEPIEFTIEAGHVTSADAPTLESLSGGNVFTGEVSTGAVSANIENKSGSTLPSTGGIGTTIFYVIGGILMVGAGVILISRKRTNK